MGVIHGDSMGDIAAARDHREAADRHGSHNLPELQRIQAEQDRPLPERDFQAGWRGGSLPSLRVEIWGEVR